MNTYYLAVRTSDSDYQRLSRYLYSYATIVATFPNGRYRRAIVAVTTSDASYHAAYQQGRLLSGSIGATATETFAQALAALEITK